MCVMYSLLTLVLSRPKCIWGTERKGARFFIERIEFGIKYALDEWIFSKWEGMGGKKRNPRMRLRYLFRW